MSNKQAGRNLVVFYFSLLVCNCADSAEIIPLLFPFNMLILQTREKPELYIGIYIYTRMGEGLHPSPTQSQLTSGSDSDQVNTLPWLPGGHEGQLVATSPSQ